jgi:hypothetical protein
MAHCVGSCGAAICLELNEKWKCVAEHFKEAATAEAAPAAWRRWWRSAAPASFALSLLGKKAYIPPLTGSDSA